MAAPKKPRKSPARIPSGKVPEGSAARASELTRILNAANAAYYVGHAPLMSDAEFDRLLRELEDLEAAHPALRSPDSPTQRVGSDLTDEGGAAQEAEKSAGFRKIPHLFPMLSIQNTYSEEEVRDFHRQVTEKVPEDALAYVCEPKIDGEIGRAHV